MFKKLTVGSLKYVDNRSSTSIDPVLPERVKGNEAPKIIGVKQNQRYFQVKVSEGQSILEAALEQKIPIKYKCKQGTCGKCTVKLVNGSTYLQPVNNLEEKKLNHLVQSGFRLACQAVVK